MSRTKAPAATSENRIMKPHSPRRACSAARRRPAASPMWVPAKRSQQAATASAGSMGCPPSAPLPRPRREQRDHVLHRFGIDRLALGEGADTGVDGGEEGAQAVETAADERRALAPAAGLVERMLPLGHRSQDLANGPAEAPLHDLLHHAPEVGGRLVMVLAGAGDGHA